MGPITGHAALLHHFCTLTKTLRFFSASQSAVSKTQCAVGGRHTPQREGPDSVPNVYMGFVVNEGTHQAFPLPVINPPPRAIHSSLSPGGGGLIQAHHAP
jgi:hypothetical protein